MGVFKFKFQLVVGVEVFDGCFCGYYQFYVLVIEFVDQIDKVVCVVVVVGVYVFYVGDQYGVEFMGDFDVVVLVVWVVIECVEIKLDYVVGGFYCGDFVFFYQNVVLIVVVVVFWCECGEMFGYEMVCFSV